MHTRVLTHISGSRVPEYPSPQTVIHWNVLRTWLMQPFPKGGWLFPQPDLNRKPVGVAGWCLALGATSTRNQSVWHGHFVCLGLRCEMAGRPHGLCLPYSSIMFFSPPAPLNRDHMQWSEEEEDAARKQVEENSATRVAPEEQGKAGLPPCPCRQALLAYTPANCWGSRFFPCSGTKINEINYVFTL